MAKVTLRQEVRRKIKYSLPTLLTPNQLKSNMNICRYLILTNYSEI